jgi:hypothetical protein
MGRLFSPPLAGAALLLASALAPQAAGAAAAGSLLAPPAAGAVSAGPLLVVEAPPALRQAAARVRAIQPAAFAEVMSLLGLAEPGPPILVRLEPEGAGAARAVAPWIAGFAEPGTATIVLFPARTPSYPNSSLDDLLRHEVAHVLTARAAAGRPLPRWFDEGLAMIAGGTWGANDHARFLLELMVDPGVPLAGLDRRFAGTERQVAGAYAVAGAFVRDLVQQHGAGAPGRILAAVAAGAPFPEAFQAGTGTTLEAAETGFWRRHSLQRWLPLATSSTTLWLGITLLALYAARRRRLRDAALRAVWEQEDRSAQGTREGDAAAGPSSGPENPAAGT